MMVRASLSIYRFHNKQPYFNFQNMFTSTTPVTNPKLLYIIEDDPIMAECIARASTSSNLTPLQDASAMNKTDQRSVLARTLANLEIQSVNQPSQADQQSVFCEIFPDAISALRAFDQALPDLILLDVLLSGPNGFTLLNELASYTDTAAIPVVIISSLNLNLCDLASYGVTAILDKSTMTPRDIQEAVRSSLGLSGAQVLSADLNCHESLSSADASGVIKLEAV